MAWGTEYKVIQFDDGWNDLQADPGRESDFTQQVNKAGRDGWRLDRIVDPFPESNDSRLLFAVLRKDDD